MSIFAKVVIKDCVGVLFWLTVYMQGVPKSKLAVSFLYVTHFLALCNGWCIFLVATYISSRKQRQLACFTLTTALAVEIDERPTPGTSNRWNSLIISTSTRFSRRIRQLQDGRHQRTILTDSNEKLVVMNCWDRCGFCVGTFSFFWRNHAQNGPVQNASFYTVFDRRLPLTRCRIEVRSLKFADIHYNFKSSQVPKARFKSYRHTGAI